MTSGILGLLEEAWKIVHTVFEYDEMTSRGVCSQRAKVGYLPNHPLTAGPFFM